MLISGTDINAQRIEFEKTVHDFGFVPSILGPVTYAFKFKNTGDQPLVIKNVSSTCGCTSSGWTKEPVKPGETGEISATYTSTNSMGPFNRKVTVYTNGSPNAVSLNIKGVVTKDIYAAFPDSINNLRIRNKNDIFFSQVLSTQTSPEQSIEVANFTDKAINFTFEDIPKYLIVNSVSSVTPNSRVSINISVDGTKVKKLGYNTDGFIIKSGNAEEKITVSYIITETVETSDNPPVCEIKNKDIDLGTKSENKISELLEIKNTGASELIIKSFTIDNRNFVSGLKRELKIKPNQTKIIKYFAKNLPKGDNSANIYLITNDPQTPVLNLTVKLKVE
jgi:hypothetical protein